MIVEMNIEAADLKAADALVRNLIPGPRSYVHTRVEVVEYVGPNGPEKNGVLVTRAVLPDQATAIGIAYQLAVALEQDCVALLDSTVRADAQPPRGMLVGPNAVKWGEFDMQFFRRY